MHDRRQRHCTTHANGASHLMPGCYSAGFDAFPGTDTTIVNQIHQLQQHQCYDDRDAVPNKIAAIARAKNMHGQRQYHSRPCANCARHEKEINGSRRAVMCATPMQQLQTHQDPRKRTPSASAPANHTQTTSQPLPARNPRQHHAHARFELGRTGKDETETHARRGR